MCDRPYLGWEGNIPKELTVTIINSDGSELTKTIIYRNVKMEEKAILYLYNYDGEYSTRMEVLSLSDALEKARKYEKVASVKDTKNNKFYSFLNVEPILYSLRQGENVLQASVRWLKE